MSLEDLGKKAQIIRPLTVTPSTLQGWVIVRTASGTLIGRLADAEVSEKMNKAAAKNVGTAIDGMLMLSPAFDHYVHGQIVATTRGEKQFSKISAQSSYDLTQGTASVCVTPVQVLFLEMLGARDRQMYSELLNNLLEAMATANALDAGVKVVGTLP